MSIARPICRRCGKTLWYRPTGGTYLFTGKPVSKWQARKGGRGLPWVCMRPTKNRYVEHEPA